MGALLVRRLQCGRVESDGSMQIGAQLLVVCVREEVYLLFAHACAVRLVSEA